MLLLALVMGFVEVVDEEEEEAEWRPLDWALLLPSLTSFMMKSFILPSAPEPECADQMKFTHLT